MATMSRGIRHIRIGFVERPMHRREALLHVCLVDDTGIGVMATVPLPIGLTTQMAEAIAASMNDGLKTALHIWDDPDDAVGAVGMPAEDVDKIKALKRQHEESA